MKTMLITVVLLIGISSAGSSGSLPIEYQIQKNYQRMKLTLNGDVRWNVARSGRSYDITVMGNPSHFIIKNIKYNFRDGIIKNFNYRTASEGVKKIVVELRSDVNDYHVYQDDVSKNLYIEFYPGRETGASIAKSKTVKKHVASAEQLPAPQTKHDVVNIAQIVLDQVEQQPKNAADNQPIKISAPSPTQSGSSSAALWLLLVSVSIIVTGGGFTVYAYIQRRSFNAVPLRHPEEHPAPKKEFRAFLDQEKEPAAVQVKTPGIVVADEDEHAFSQSIEFAEQFVRSQGEYELQQRLENMSSRSVQKKISVTIPSVKRKDPALVAQKLGLSVGELELVTRLQRFHKQHSSEVV